MLTACGGASLTGSTASDEPRPTEIPSLDPEAAGVTETPPALSGDGSSDSAVAEDDGLWNCTGSISGGDAMAVVRATRPKVQSCYEREVLRTQPERGGAVVIHVRVDASGGVFHVQVSGDLAVDESLVACLEDVASEWQFRSPIDGHCGVVSVPFRFLTRT